MLSKLCLHIVHILQYKLSKIVKYTGGTLSNMHVSLRPHAIATLNSVGRPKSPLQATAANINCTLRRGSSTLVARQLIYPIQRHYNTSSQTVYYCQNENSRPPTRGVSHEQGLKLTMGGHKVGSVWQSPFSSPFSAPLVITSRPDWLVAGLVCWWFVPTSLSSWNLIAAIIAEY